MRKIFMFNMMTLDGYFEGSNADINWHVVDDEFAQFAIEQMKTVDLLLFGRKTYQMMAEFWPTSQAVQDDPLTAERMNSLPKIVFSKSLKKADWQNTRLVSGNVVEEIRRLKEQPGGEIALFGSADVGAALTAANLIDEYRVMVNPVILGQGTPLFKAENGNLKLKLLNTRIFTSGNVLLIYAPTR